MKGRKLSISADFKLLGYRLFPLFIFLHSFNISAQKWDSVFVFKDLQPDFAFEGKQTILRGHRVQLYGIRGGIQWQKKYRAGLGYYFLSSKVDETVSFQGNDVPARLHFSYLAAYGEYTFFHNKKWTLNIGAEPEIGRKYNEHFFVTGGSENLENQIFLGLEPYISGNYKILYWIGLSGGVSYRQVILGYPLNSYRLSGPGVNFSVVIFFGDLYNKFVLGE